MNIIKQAMKEIGLSIAIKLNMAETAQKIAESDPKMLNSGHIASAIKSGNVETLDKLLETRGKYGDKFPGTGEDSLFQALNDSSNKKFGAIMQTLDKHQMFEAKMDAFQTFNLYANKPFDSSSFNSFLTQSNISQAVATGFLAQTMDGANGGMIQTMASKNLLDTNMRLATTLAGSNEHTHMTLVGIAANVDNISALKALDNVYTNQGTSPKGTDLIAIKDFAFRSKQVYDNEVYYHKEVVMKALENMDPSPMGSILNVGAKAFQQHSEFDSPRYKEQSRCPFKAANEQIPTPRNSLTQGNPGEYDRRKHWNGYTPEEVKYISGESNKILNIAENKLSTYDSEVYQSIQIDRDLNIKTNKELSAGVDVSQTKELFLQINKSVTDKVREAREAASETPTESPKKPRPQ